MHTVHFWGQERGLPVGREYLPVTEKESMQERKKIIFRLRYERISLQSGSQLQVGYHCYNTFGMHHLSYHSPLPLLD